GNDDRRAGRRGPDGPGHVPGARMVRRSLRVLMVEDSASDADLLGHTLRHAGYDLSYERGQTAEAMKEALQQNDWDVGLCDYSSPSFTAPEALEVLKSTGQDIPFIILSGTIGEETAVAALKAGAHDFLLKDRLARLLPAIERELRDVAERRERVRAQ